MPKTETTKYYGEEMKQGYQSGNHPDPSDQTVDFPEGEWKVNRVGSGRTIISKGIWHIADLGDHNMSDEKLKKLEGILNYVGI